MIHFLRLLAYITIGGLIFVSSGWAADMVATLPARVDFHVATNGQDTNPGTADAPFATLARAREAVREKVTAGLKADVLVLIQGGVYPQTETLTFGPEDSGTPEHAITYAAVPGEEVTLNGGRVITGWQKGPGEIWTAEIPEVKAGKWYFRQLFVNGTRAVRARTPNAPDDNGAWWKIVSSTATQAAPPAKDEPITIKVSGPIAAWKNPEDIELVLTCAG
jgi:hypothetical protein